MVQGFANCQQVSTKQPVSIAFPSICLNIFSYFAEGIGSLVKSFFDAIESAARFQQPFPLEVVIHLGELPF
jgi:hypothetical protein